MSEQMSNDALARLYPSNENGGASHQSTELPSNVAANVLYGETIKSIEQANDPKRPLYPSVEGAGTNDQSVKLPVDKIAKEMYGETQRSIEQANDPTREMYPSVEPGGGEPGSHAEPQESWPDFIPEPTRENLDEALMPKIKEAFKGIDKEQAAGIFQLYQDEMERIQGTVEQFRRESHQQTVAHYGQDSLTDAHEALGIYMGEDFVPGLKKLGMDNHPMVVQMVQRFDDLAVKAAKYEDELKQLKYEKAGRYGRSRNTLSRSDLQALGGR